MYQVLQHFGFAAFQAHMVERVSTIPLEHEEPAPESVCPTETCPPMDPADLQ